MRNIGAMTSFVGILVCGSIGVAAAQSSDATSGNEGSSTQPAVAVEPADDTLPDVSDTTLKKNGGGLFGKVKSVAKNKVVQQVAKTAACTMIPGGQVVAGAIDAAANKDAAGAAAGAATGSTCMPGMGGAAGAMAGGAMAGGAMPGGAIPGAAGLTAAAAAGAGGPPSGMDPAMMAAYSAQMAAAMQAMMAQGGNGGAGMPPGMPPGAMAMPPGMGMPPGAMGAPGEGGGKALEVSDDLPGDLKKGKTVIRNIDWVPGGGTVSPAGADGFTQAMAQVGAAMKQAGGSFRLDLYMDKQSGDAVVKTLGPQRLVTVQSALVEGGASPGADGPQIGKSKKDGDPRLEIVKLK